MTKTHRTSRPWDPTPEEAEVTRAAVALVAGFDAMIAQLQAQRAAAVEIATSVALAQRERYERVPVGETREGEPIFEPDDAPVRAMVAELSLATRASRRAVGAEVSDVWELSHRFAGVRGAFEAGEIDAGRASVLVSEGARLVDDDVRAEYERLAVPHAAAKTVYGTRRAARRIAAELEPESLTARHERARRARGVFVRDLEDGMAELCLVADAVTVYGAHDRLTQMARRVVAVRATGAANDGANGGEGAAIEVRCDDCRTKGDACAACVEAAEVAAAAFAQAAAASAGAGVKDAASDAADACAANTACEDTPVTGGDGEPVVDARSFSQVRADLAVDLLLTGEPDAHHVADPTGLSVLAALRGKVQVTIPVTTLAGLDDAPADLAGYGPVAETVANPIAAGAATWARLFHRPRTGALLTVDRYAPTSAQRRYLVARDQTCVFPHCERRATGADIDHTHDHAHGGKTNVSNLAHLCRFHHVLKHTTAWSYTVQADGDVRWRSPAGQERAARAKSAVAFVDADHARAARPRRRDGMREDSAGRTPPGPPHRDRRARVSWPSTRTEWETAGTNADMAGAQF
ncbi:HNH endonuclease signature motif containing protein [Microbacterium halophytorum]|uniref:HNH endonuclease signature motif containing protein n=1 Tax=Microbacterium halophytorum TaxID=2067568 RepID=UPI000CFAB299|nr:HNH endonuclease signature motif containing protein [Microbacterium halophytorum]